MYFPAGLHFRFFSLGSGISDCTHCITFSVVSSLPHYFPWNTNMQATEEFQELLMASFSSAKVRKTISWHFLLFPFQGTAAFPLHWQLAKKPKQLVNRELSIIHKNWA